VKMLVVRYLPSDITPTVDEETCRL